MHRASWPLIPHQEARTGQVTPPGDSPGGSGSMRVLKVSRPAVWSRQRARSRMAKFLPSSTQPLPPRPEVIMTLTKMALSAACQAFKLCPDSFTSFV